MVESRSMVNGVSPGPRTGGPGPGQQLPAHPVQLADMAPPEAAQERPQGGGRLDDHAPQNTEECPPRTQRIGIVNAVAARQRRGHQRQHLVSRVRPPRRAAQVEVAVNEFTQAHVLGQGGRKKQPGIVDQAVVVEGDLRMRSGLFCGSILYPDFGPRQQLICGGPERGRPVASGSW